MNTTNNSLVGKIVTVTGCTSQEHGTDIAGCLCHLRGQKFRVIGELDRGGSSRFYRIRRAAQTATAFGDELTEEEATTPKSTDS